MNHKTVPTYILLRRAVILDVIQRSGMVNGKELTELGKKWVESELQAIETVLEERKPENDFVTLLTEDGQPVGFETV